MPETAIGYITDNGAGYFLPRVNDGDFALGLSRQLYGLTMHSERPAHRMYEQWHPMGVVGIISACRCCFLLLSSIDHAINNKLDYVK